MQSTIINKGVAVFTCKRTYYFAAIIKMRFCLSLMSDKQNRISFKIYYMPAFLYAKGTES